MFKECLRNGITPFIIEDDIKEFYYRQETMPVTRAASYMEGIMGKQVEDNVGKSDILDNTGFRFLFGQGE